MTSMRRFGKHIPSIPRLLGMDHGVGHFEEGVEGLSVVEGRCDGGERLSDMQVVRQRVIH